MDRAGEVRLGRQRSPQHQSGRFTTLYLRVANVFDGWIDYSDVLAMDFTPRERTIYGLRPGDILLNEGQSLELVGRSAIYADQPGKYCFQNTIVRFRCNATTIPEYGQAVFTYWLRTGRFRQVARQTTSIAHLGADRFARMLFPRPPRREQEEIAEVLGALETSLREMEALIAKLRLARAGLLNDLLTRGVDEDGRVRSEATHEFKDSPLGRIPADWWVAKVGDLFEERSERGKPGLPIMSVVMNDGLVERASVERRVDSRLPPEGHALVRKGDITYNMMRMWQGVLGRADFDCLVSPAYVVLRPNGRVDSRFAEWLFRDRRSVLKFRRSSRGVVDDRLRLYADDMLSIQFAVPKGLEEQRAIARRLDTMDALMLSERAMLRKEQRLAAGMKQDLLTGRVRVRDAAKLA